MSDRGKETQSADSRNDEELKAIFGEHALVSRVGNFNLVHLDHPSPEEIQMRIDQFDPEDFFEDDCPLCRMLREQGCNIVYDDGSGWLDD